MTDRHLSYWPILVLVAALSLSACNRSTSAQEEVSATSGNALSHPLDALKARTLNQLVFVEGGVFEMGDVGYLDEQGRKQYFSRSSDNKLIREVTISSYSIMAFEALYEEVSLYAQISQDEDMLERLERNKTDPVFQPGFPAWFTNWHQARAYCQWLGELIDYPMDLPTEAQWEYAARSRGQVVAHGTDDGTIDPGRNYGPYFADAIYLPSGAYPPNPLGLYDLQGTVMNWTFDAYTRIYYGGRQETNPTGPPEEDRRLRTLRGPSTEWGVENSTLYIRDGVPPGGYNGVRCAVNHPEPVKAPGGVVFNRLTGPFVKDTIDRSGNTALHQAVRTGNMDAVIALEHKRHNPFARNKQQQTPIDLALSSNNEDLVAWGRSYLFVSAGRLHALLMRLVYLELEPEVYLKELRAALESELFYLNAPNIRFRHYRTESGWPRNHVDQGSIAHHLVIQNQPEALALLLDYGLDPTLTNNAHQTALGLARELGDREAIVALLMAAMP